MLVASKPGTGKPVGRGRARVSAAVYVPPSQRKSPRSDFVVKPKSSEDLKNSPGFCTPDKEGQFTEAPSSSTSLKEMECQGKVECDNTSAVTVANDNLPITPHSTCTTSETISEIIDAKEVTGVDSRPSNYLETSSEILEPVLNGNSLLTKELDRNEETTTLHVESHVDALAGGEHQCPAVELLSFSSDGDCSMAKEQESSDHKPGVSGEPLAGEDCTAAPTGSNHTRNGADETIIIERGDKILVSNMCVKDLVAENNTLMDSNAEQSNMAEVSSNEPDPSNVPTKVELSGEQSQSPNEDGMYFTCRYVLVIFNALSIRHSVHVVCMRYNIAGIYLTAVVFKQMHLYFTYFVLSVVQPFS